MLKVFIFIFITFAAYFIQIASFSDSVFEFTLESKEDIKPDIDIYFSKSKGQYIPSKTLEQLYFKKNTYHYRIEDVEKGYFLRFDPSRTRGTYYLSNVKIRQNIWFSQYTYSVPIESINKMQDISIISTKGSVLAFEVIGDDSQFEIELKNKLENLILEKTTLFYRSFLDKFFIALLIAIIIFIMYNFMTNKKNHNWYNTIKLFLYILAFVFAIIKTSYYIKTVVAFHPPDESQHLAYVKYLHQNNSVIIPKFEDMRNLYDTGYCYLVHPPMYYHILNFSFDKDVTTNMNLPLFRHMSRLIFLFSLLLLLYMGWQARMRIIGDIVYLSILSSVPLYAYLGASINNDNLAFLGASLFFVSFLRLVKKQYTNITYFMLGLSIFIGYFAKLTVVIFIVMTLLFYLFYLLKQKEMIKITPLQIVILLSLFVPILYYQWYIYQEYHALMPSYRITHPEEFLKSPYYIEESKRIYLSAYEWFRKMSIFSAVGWFNIQSHNYFFKANWIDYIGVVTIHMFAVASIFMCSEKKSSILVVGKITLFAFMSVFLIQYFFTYSNHLKYGYMGGTQSRYLLPFIASLAIMASLFVNKYSKNLWISSFIIILCIHAIYSDFFYFLLYYK